jgi:hypothetical protein
MIDLKMANASLQAMSLANDATTCAMGLTESREGEFAEAAFRDVLTSLVTGAAPAVVDDTTVPADGTEATVMIVAEIAAPSAKPEAIPLPSTSLNPQFLPSAPPNMENFNVASNPLAVIDELLATDDTREAIVGANSGASTATSPPQESAQLVLARHENPAAALQDLRTLTGGEPSVAEHDDGFDLERRDQSVSTLAMQTAPLAHATDELETHFKEASLPRIAQTVGSNAWRQELTQRINLMIDNGAQVLTLRLTPEHLGPLEIRVAVREGDTSLWFGAPHPETRQALEQTLPRLREQFAQAGLTLGQSWISNGSPQQSAQQQARPVWFDTTRDLQSNKPDPGIATAGATLALIDTYV